MVGSVEKKEQRKHTYTHDLEKQKLTLNVRVSFCACVYWIGCPITAALPSVRSRLVSQPALAFGYAFVFVCVCLCPRWPRERAPPH